MAVSISWKSISRFIWLLMAAICLLLALIFWVLNNKQSIVEVVEPEQKAQEAVRPVKNETVASDMALASFAAEVPTLSLQQRVVARGDRAPEFRGSKFVSEQSKFWALELMRVSEEDIIKSYLDKREDRSKFQYFRLQSDGQAEQFVLTYGKFKDVNEVLQKTKSIDFDLPKNIQIKPEKFSSYASSINDLGYDETSTGLKLRPIILTKAALPVLPRATVSSPRSAQQGVEDGVVTSEVARHDLPEQSSNPEPKVEKKPIPTQVVDPFN